VSTSTDLLSGVAGVLQAGGVVTWRTDGSAYLSSETGLTFKDMPPDPDRLVVLTTFGASDNPKLPLGQPQIQVRFRGTTDPRDVDDLGDSAFVLLHGLTDRVFGSCHLIQMLRVNSIPLGMDQQSRRWERSDNYALDVDYPASTYRPT